MLENPEPMARGHPHDKSGRENVERNREEHPEALVIARPCCQRRAPSEKNRGGGLLEVISPWSFSHQFLNLR